MIACRKFLVTARCLLCLGFLAAAWAAAQQPAGESEEDRLFNGAARAFQQGFMEVARKGLAEFVVKYPTSARVSDAVLLQARATFNLTNHEAAIALLTNQLPRAGLLADQYRYWLAEFFLEDGKFAQAAESFAQLAKDFTDSNLLLEAAFGEAQARYSLREWPQVTRLLEDPRGSFRRAAEKRPNDELVARGELLLATAFFEQREFARAEAVIRQLAQRALSPELKWEQLYLLCRVEQASDRLEAALVNTTNLVTLATTNARPAFLGASVSLQGQLLQQLNRLEAAVAAYERNQAEGIPPERKREATFKIIELRLAQNDLSNAVVRLEQFLAQTPPDPAADLGLVTLGELRLRQHYQHLEPGRTATNAPPPGTNFIQLALNRFDQVIREHPQSVYLGRAHLGRGWCLLTAGKTSESVSAFRTASEKLPLSEAQAVARFKLGDLQLQQQEFTNAIRNYQRVLNEYTNFPAVQRELAPRAVYQMLHASIAAADLATAEEAARNLLERAPEAPFTERSLLLYGEGLAELRHPAAARTMFAEFVKRFPQSSLVPEAELAIARSWEREQNWGAARAAYDGWVTRYTTHSNLVRAEFQRAHCYWRAGDSTNAFQLFTNYVARFPAHPLAARAQDWIGDYFYRVEDFREAERNYQLLYQNTNWPSSELMFRARLKAGRSAFMRPGGWNDAIAYFTNLITDARCPAPLAAEAHFAYGDTLLKQPRTTNAMVRFEEAIVVFSRIPLLFPNDPLAIRALGQIANCNFQLGSQDPRRYLDALTNYHKVASAPAADVVARSQAQVGLGNVYLQQAQLASQIEAPALQQTALEHYLKVFYGTHLREGEQPDLFWTVKAGIAAARLVEGQKQWDKAIQLYKALLDAVPAMRPSLERRIAAARDQLANRSP